MSRNVRGLGSEEKRRAVKDLVRRTQSDVILFQETKPDPQKEKVAMNFAKALNDEWDFFLENGGS